MSDTTEQQNQKATYDFEADSQVLAEKGNWKLVVYNNRCLCLLSKDGQEIKTLSCVVPTDDNGLVQPEAYLLDVLDGMFMEMWLKRKENQTNE